LRRHVLVLGLPLLLAACESSTPPAGGTAAPQPAPAVEVPAVEAPAASAPPASTGQAALDPLIGSWAASPANCASPILITADSFQGLENTCQIGGWTDNGDGTFTAAMTCQSEGQTASESIQMEPLFGPQGEGIRLSYVDRGGDPVTVFSCPAPRQQ
jgi:hypothetical protein